jgi:hypothetical protein
MGKIITKNKTKRINLDLLYSETPTSSKKNLDTKDYFYDYNPEEEYRNPEHKKIIPDGEQAFFSAIKNGEDW